MDEEVRAIMTRLEAIKQNVEILGKEADALWSAFFKIADARAGEGAPFRFLDEELGVVIARQIATSGSIDSAALEKQLTEEQWGRVSELRRVLNTTLLEAEALRDPTIRSTLDTCSQVKKIVRRYGPRRASKEDLAELEAQEAR